jgi:hypothetical protein
VTTPDTEPAADTPAPPAPATFRVPLVSLVAVVFLALSLSPIAFQGGAWFALLLIPLAIAWWVLRTCTVVDADVLRVRTAWGSTRWAWSRVATLRLVDRRWVRAVGTSETQRSGARPSRGDAELVLRGVRVRDLGRVGEASGGRIRVPSPAEAQAAEDHRRELEAARMRIARLREQHPELTSEQAEAAEAGDAADTGDTAEGVDADGAEVPPRSSTADVSREQS